MQPWKQPTTAPRQPDFNADQAIEDDLRGRTERRRPEDPSLSRDIDVRTRYPGGRELLWASLVTLGAVAVIVAILLAIYGW